MKSKSLFTFGQNHAHRLPNCPETFDRDIVVSITSDDPRADMFRLFGNKWAMQYDEEPPDMRHYPRGVFDLTPYL